MGMQLLHVEVPGFIQSVGEDAAARRGAEVGELQAEPARPLPPVQAPAVPVLATARARDSDQRAQLDRSTRRAPAARSSAYSRTIASSANTDRPSISLCLTSEASTSAGEGLEAVPSHDRSAPIASTASRVNRVANTPRSASSRAARREQAHAPVDRRAHRAVPLGQVARGGGQQGEAALQPLRDSGGREHADLRGGQLDGQRETLQAPADVADVGGVLLGDPNRARPPRTIDEQRARRGATGALEAQPAARHRESAAATS